MGWGQQAWTIAHTTPLHLVTQAWIRSRYSKVSSRPAITVYITPGDYYYGQAAPGHVAHGSSSSTGRIALFDERDSGASATAPITYTAAPGSASQPRFIGGRVVRGLAWSTAPPSSGLPPGVLQAKVPGTLEFGGVEGKALEFDHQDQLFLRAGGAASGGGAVAPLLPLVRARTPSGKPWVPMDGFNLSVVGGWDYLNPSSSSNKVLPSPPALTKCDAGPPPAPPRPGRPTPPRGGCSPVLANTTLLNGLVPLPAANTTDTAAACGALCEADTCCGGWTWHDRTTGGYYKQCYLVASGQDPWATSATGYSGHESGLCDHSSIRPPPVCVSSSNTCRHASILCAPNTTQQYVLGPVGVKGRGGARGGWHDYRRQMPGAPARYRV